MKEPIKRLCPPHQGGTGQGSLEGLGSGTSRCHSLGRFNVWSLSFFSNKQNKKHPGDKFVRVGHTKWNNEPKRQEQQPSHGTSSVSEGYCFYWSCPWILIMTINNEGWLCPRQLSNTFCTWSQVLTTAQQHNREEMVFVASILQIVSVWKGHIAGHPQSLHEMQADSGLSVLHRFATQEVVTQPHIPGIHDTHELQNTCSLIIISNRSVLGCNEQDST